ncbi:MAG: hypothetical protein ABI649_10230 [Gaiellaceae bacterium]
MARYEVIWWNAQRLLAPTGSNLGRALDATAADGWTRSAYKAKLERLAALLLDITDTPPALLAMAEVENGRVAADLLAAAGWNQLSAVSDPTALLAGDDVVMLYDPAQLELIGEPASYNVNNRYTTRDLLEVEFRTADGHEFAVIAAHWPSRRISNSDALRIGLADYTARLVRRRLMYAKEELLTKEGRAKMPSATTLEKRWNYPVLVIGDLNDDPYERSVAEILGASRTRSQAEELRSFPRSRGLAGIDAYLARDIRLYNPTWKVLLAPDTPSGTTYWDSRWYMLDQAIFSRGFLVGPLRFDETSLAIHAPRQVRAPNGPFTFTSSRGIPQPFDAKTRRGISDHLPLSFALETP